MDKTNNMKYLAKKLGIVWAFIAIVPWVNIVEGPMFFLGFDKPITAVVQLLALGVQVVGFVMIVFYSKEVFENR